MEYGSRKDFVVNHTLRLVALAGQFMQTENQDLLVRAKAVAQAMAEELNMPEALQDIQPTARENIIEVRQRFIVATGRLAKACEALDHLEDFPSRQVLEENIRKILQL